jgi:hypothetical protein
MMGGAGMSKKKWQIDKRRLVWSKSLTQQMQALHNVVQGFPDEARAKDNPDEHVLCKYMIDHEMAQVEFARRELPGDILDQSLAPVGKEVSAQASVGSDREGSSEPGCPFVQSPPFDDRGSRGSIDWLAVVVLVTVMHHLTWT